MKLRHWIAAAALGCLAITPVRAETTVTFMGWVGMFDFQKPGWARIVDNFQKANPDIKINYIGTPAEDTLRQIIAATLAHRAPDILQILPAWVPTLAEQDALEPLGPLMGADEIARTWKNGVKSLTFDGKLLAMPWLPSPNGLSYNRNLFIKAGLDPDKPPTTWQGFLDAVNKICALPAEGGVKTFGVALRSTRDVIAMIQVPFWVYGFGGDVVDAKGKVSLDNPGAIKAFQWFHDMIQQSCAPDAADTQVGRTLFAQGRAGFEFDGVPIKGLVKTMSDGKMVYGPHADLWLVPPMTDLSGRIRMLGSGNVLSISSASKNKAAAAKFIRFMLDDPEVVNYFFETSQQITTGNIEVIRNGPMGKDEYLRQFIDPWDNVEILPIKSPRYDAILDAMGLSLQKVIKGADAATELHNLTAQLQDIDR